MPDEPEDDAALTGGEFGQVIADNLDDAATPAKPGDGAKLEDETEAHPS